jgi:hypothetical protein
MSKQKITIEVDSEIYKAFRVKLDESYEKAPKILMCAMNSFAEGTLVQSGMYLVPSGNPLATPPVPAKRGRPPIYKEEPPPPPEPPKRKAVPRRRLKSYPIPREIDLQLDPRPHLSFSTPCDFEVESGLSNVEKIRFTSFGHICETEYLLARVKCDERKWITEYPDFIGHCAGMLFTHTKLANEYRFEPASLEQDVFKLQSEKDWQIDAFVKWQETQEAITYED